MFRYTESVNTATLTTQRFTQHLSTPGLAKSTTSFHTPIMPVRTTRRTTNEEGKGKTRAYTPYPLSRQPSHNPMAPDPRIEQGMLLLRPPFAHKSSSSSSSGSSRGQRSLRVDLGMPTREEFAALQEQYVESLDKRKQKKALISQEMFDKIWLVLHFPDDVTVETAQFRWWVRKMFALVHPCQLPGDVLPALESRPSWQQDRVSYPSEAIQAEGVVVHDGKRVAVREQIYDIVAVCHQRVLHSGRDKTCAEIKKIFTWVPKDLIAMFVKNCPTCVHKKTGTFEEYPAEEHPMADVLPITKMLASPILCDSGIMNVTPRYLPVPANKVAASRSNLAFSPSTRSLAPDDSGPLLSLPPLAYSGFPPGPGPVAHPSGDHYTSQGNLTSHPSCWQVYQSTSACDLTPSGTAWPLVPDDSALVPIAHQNSFVQLPSIHVGSGLPHSGMYYSHPTSKVTLPSFSEVCSGRLTLDGSSFPRSHARQPLQALPHNVGAGFGGGGPSLQVPAQHTRFVPVHYAPPGSPHAGMVPIDPALLFPEDGVRMLAIAAEARELDKFNDENVRM